METDSVWHENRSSFGKRQRYVVCFIVFFEIQLLVTHTLEHERTLTVV